MPRGIAQKFKDQFVKASVGSIFYLLRVTLIDGTKRFWGERKITWSGDTYEPRLLGVSGLGNDPFESNKVSFKLANVDGVLTTLDQSISMLGSRCELFEYVSDSGVVGLPDAYLKWQGHSDEFGEIASNIVVLSAFANIPTLRSEAPHRLVDFQCPWSFANLTTTATEIRTANKTVVNFEGFECPYSQTASIGFRADLQTAIDATTDPIVFTIRWPAVPKSNGAEFKVNEFIKIDSEKLKITGVDNVNFIGLGDQVLTAARGQKKTNKAAHVVSTGSVFFEMCFFSVEACKRRGMYGNNPNDLNAVNNKRNYFGGFPTVSPAVESSGGDTFVGDPTPDQNMI